MSIATEFRERTKVLIRADFQEVTGRLVALLEWMESQPEILPILNDLRETGIGGRLLQAASYQMPPQANTLGQIASVGLAMIDLCENEHAGLGQLAMGSGVCDSSGSLDHASDEALQRYIEPFLNFVLHRLPEDPPSAPAVNVPFTPVAIQESLVRFREDHPCPGKVAFIMMQFGSTTAHIAIEKAIKSALQKYGITGLLARDKEYHDELYPNIQTYLHGSDFGIAVFERIQQEDFNPNVSLEVGYMLGLKKPVLLLKDQTLQTLQTDLVGRLYRSFNTLDPANTIPPPIERWMEDKGII